MAIMPIASRNVLLELHSGALMFYYKRKKSKLAQANFFTFA